MSRFIKSLAAKAAALPASNHIEDISKGVSDFTHSRQEDTYVPKLWFIPDDLQFPPRVQKGPAHTRRKPESHIPKTRNAFFLFRSLFVGRKVLPNQVAFCQHNRQVSRIASHVWKALPEGERARFHQFDEEEKRAHQIQHPGYQWTSRKATRMQFSTKKLPSDETEMDPEQIACKRIAELVLKNLQGEELATRVQEVVNTTLPGSWLDITTLSSNSSEAARKNGTTAVTPKPASKGLVRHPKKAVKNSRTPCKSRSSSSKSRKSKSSLDRAYPRFTNPRRRATIIRYPEVSNDENDELISDNDTEYHNLQSSTRPTSVASGDAALSSPNSAGISTPSRFSSPFDVRDMGEGSFDWAKEMAIHKPAFGDESSFEPYEDRYDTLVNECPYVTWSIQFPSGVHAYEDTLQLEDVQMAMGELSLTQDCLGNQSQTISPERLHL